MLKRFLQKRSHTCGLDDEYEVESCNTYTGSYTSWTMWTRCSATCGGGTRTRKRTHTCGLSDDDQVEVSCFYRESKCVRRSFEQRSTNEG